MVQAQRTSMAGLMRPGLWCTLTLLVTTATLTCRQVM